MSRFKKPGNVSGLKWDELDGSLLMVYPKRVEHDVKTRVGVKDVVRGDVHVLDGPQVGKIYSDTMIFPVVLQDQLRPEIASVDPVLGRLGKGEAKNGQNPPWKLFEASDEDEGVADQYVDNGAIGAGQLGENGASDDVPLSDNEDDGPGW